MKTSLLFFFLLILGCATHSEPEWFTSQPKTDGYWLGIGIIEKSSHEGDCREEAKNLALSEISSQISVEISGSFERIVTENNLLLEDFSQSITKMHVEKNLPKVEYVDFHDSKEKCGILARLSQSVYYETIALQRQNAIQTSIGLLEQAESIFNYQTFSYLNDAIVEIMPYMDVPIAKEYPIGSGRIINVPRHLKILANQYMNRLKIIPNQSNIDIKRGFTKDIELGIQIIDKTNNIPMENIPIMCYNEIESYHAISNSDGNCIFSLPKIIKNKSVQHVNYEVDKFELLKNLDMFGSFSNVQVQSMIKVSSPLIHINIIENNLDELSSNPYIQPVISEFFSQNYSANFIDEDNADIVINGVVNTRAISDLPNEYGIYQVFGDLTISISYGDSGEEVMRKSYNRIQGSDFNSNHEAATQSLKKISEKIIKDFLPELLTVIEGL